LIQLDDEGVSVVNLVVGGLLYLVVYLTLAPILGAVEKQGILNLRTLGGTRIVALLVNPIFDYESKLLSVVNRKWKTFRAASERALATSLSPRTCRK
jgi:hypothetical protein